MKWTEITKASRWNTPKIQHFYIAKLSVQMKSKSLYILYTYFIMWTMGGKKIVNHNPSHYIFRRATAQSGEKNISPKLNTFRSVHSFMILNSFHLFHYLLQIFDVVVRCTCTSSGKKRSTTSGCKCFKLNRIIHLIEERQKWNEHAGERQPYSVGSCKRKES